MASSLGDLIVRIGADVSDLTAGLGSVTGLLETSASTWAAAGGVLSASVTAPLVALGYAAFDAGETFDAAGKKIEERTGTTGPALDSLKASFEAVFTNVPTSAGAAADAITQLNQALGLTGAPLTEIATQVVSLNRMLGEMAPSAQSVAQMFNQWNVAASDQSGILDQLFVAYQKTGTSIASMTGELATFGPQLQGMGFDLTTSIALLAQFGAAGVNTSAVVRGLNTALANFAKQGVADPAAALADLIQKIKDAGTTTEATGLIVADFGARAAVQFATAVRAGRLDVDDLVTSLNNAGGSITATEQKTRTLGDAWTLFKNQLDAATKPLGTELVQGLESASKSGTGLVSVVSDLVKWFTSLSGPTQTVILAVAGFAAAIGPAMLAMGGIIASGGVLMTFIEALAPAVLAAALSFATFIQDLGPLTGALGAAATATGLVVAAIGGIKLGEWLQSLTSDYQNAEAEVNKLAVALQAQGVEVDRGGASLKDWAAKVFTAADNAKTLQDEVAKDTAILKDHGVTIEQGSMSLDTYAGMLEQLAKKYDPLKEKQQQQQEQQETENQKMKEYVAWVNAENAAIDEEIKYRSKQFDAYRQLVQSTNDALAADNDFAEGILRVKDAHAQLGYVLELITPALEAMGQQISTADGLTNEYSDALHSLDPALDTTGTLMQRVQDAGIQNSAALMQASDASYNLWQQTLNTTDAEGKQVFTTGELNQAYLDFLTNMKASSLAAGTWTSDNEDALKRTQEAVNGTFTATKTAADTWQSGITGAIKTAAGSMSSNLADVITGTKDLGTAFDDMGKSILKSILDVVIKQGLKALWKELTDAMADGGILSGFLNAFKDLFSKIGGWISDLGSSIAGIFSGAGTALSGVAGGAGQAAGTAVDLSGYYGMIQGTGAAGEAAGGAASAAGGAAGLAGSLASIGSIANIAGLGVSIASGIVSGIQQAHANNLLAEIEESTRYTKGYVLGLLGQGWGIIDQLNRIIFLDLEEYIKPAIDAVNDTIAGFYNMVWDIGYKNLIPDLHTVALALAGGAPSETSAIGSDALIASITDGVRLIVSGISALAASLTDGLKSMAASIAGGLSALPASTGGGGAAGTSGIIDAINSLSSIVSDGFKSLVDSGLSGAAGSTSSLSDALRSISAAVGISYQPSSLSMGGTNTGAAGSSADLSALVSSVTDGLKALLGGLSPIADGIAGLSVVIESSASSVLDGLKSIGISLVSLTSSVSESFGSTLQAIGGLSDSVATGFETLLNILDAGYKALVPDIHMMAMAAASGGPVINLNIPITLDGTQITNVVMNNVTNTLQQQGGKL